MSQRTFKFKVELTLDPEDQYDWAGVRDYVADAVRSWGGQFHPDDALFGLDKSQVKVTRYKEPRA